jgi:hypothetical protein
VGRKAPKSGAKSSTAKNACDFNGEDPADVAEPGDSDETIRYRIFMHHAAEALRHANTNGFERATPPEITDEIITAATQTADAWSTLAAKLKQKRREKYHVV